MAAHVSSEKIDLLVYGPHKPIVDKGFNDQFVLHHFEQKADLERLSPATLRAVEAEVSDIARFLGRPVGMDVLDVLDAVG